MLSSLLFCEPILFRLDIYLIPHTFSSEGLRVACGKTETGSAATSAPSDEHLSSDCPVSTQITRE